MQTHNWEYFPQEKHQPKRGWKLNAWIAKCGEGWGWIVRDLMASITFLVSKKSNKDWCIEHLTSVCLAPWWEQFQLMMASTQTPAHTNTTKYKYTSSTTQEHNEIQIHKLHHTRTQGIANTQTPSNMNTTKYTYTLNACKQKHKTSTNIQAKHTLINLKQTRTQTNKHTHINTIGSQKHTDVSERNHWSKRSLQFPICATKIRCLILVFSFVFLWIDFFVFLHFLFLFNCVPSVSPYIVYLIG